MVVMSLLPLSKGKDEMHVHVSWAQPHVHDKDEKEWDHSVIYGNSMNNG